MSRKPSHITFTQYRKAKQIVRQYERYLSKLSEKRSPKAYSFMYWINWEHYYREDKTRFATILAPNITVAVERFLKRAPKSLARVDMEVAYKNTFLDVSQFPQLQNYF